MSKTNPTPSEPNPTSSQENIIRQAAAELSGLPVVEDESLQRRQNEFDQANVAPPPPQPMTWEEQLGLYAELVRKENRTENEQDFLEAVGIAFVLEDLFSEEEPSDNPPPLAPPANPGSSGTLAPILALLLGLGGAQLRADDTDWLQPRGPIPAVVVEQTGGLVITTASPDPVVPLVPLGNGQTLIDPSSSARSGSWDTPDIRIHGGSDR